MRTGADGLPYMQFISGQYEEQLFMWEDRQDDEALCYFFLPAFVKGHKIWFNKDSVEIYAGGEKVGERGYFEWQDGEIYHIRILKEDWEGESERNIVFMQSENLPAIFIETTSGSMEYLHQSKENKEQGNIVIVSEQGNMEYRGELPRISGRGNYSWTYEKKSYSFNLKDAQPLCGLDKGKKWNLLAVTRERTKLLTKLALDMGSKLEMEYSPQGTWIDLYLNGEYAGNYLLTESVSVGEGRVEIYDLEKNNEKLNPYIESADSFTENGMKGYDIESGEPLEGGYLLEYDAIYYNERSNGFTTDKNYKFTVREPSHASREQLTYIKNYIQNIENVLSRQDDDYTDYIDQDSFVAKFLVEEITKNYDAYCTSTYFYKDWNDNLLYAGPIWDYDAAWGTVNHDAGWENPDGLIVDDMRRESMDWFAGLYHNDTFRKALVARYADILPELEIMLDSGIDQYIETIRSSVRMDEIRWNIYPISGSGNYTTYENSVKYLKFFLARRLNYLNRTWGVSYREFEIPSDGIVHMVSFYMDGELIEQKEMLDGELLGDMPKQFEGKFDEWNFYDGQRKYWDDMQMPIYEDVIFEAHPAISPSP